MGLLYAFPISREEEDFALIQDEKLILKTYGLPYIFWFYAFSCILVVGFMFMAQDAKEYPQFLALENAFGTAKVRVQSSTGTMMERISSGENLIGYNVLGSYALVRAKTDPSIGVVLPKDYTLILSRVQFINKNAKNVNASKLWLDYILSHRGQTIIANGAKLYAIRADVTGETTSADLIKEIGAANIKPVPVHPIILQFLGPAKRMAFLKQWKETAGKK